ncbi:VanZ family protein [Pelagicoccus sp. SDUM812002]|uniref:VanZ family protein n=1 Tax=Pelagicoccus sp. SDUM812002 TaxID=3041266 RepID=UPI00280DDE59|nr:VanZ family protein [Pelagicoccus sp. SDUM812002]MDQ8185562.1 VanZ family protein [Pelagicoccus sp. SDUM812002]
MQLQPTFRRSVMLLLVLITLSFGWWPFTFSPDNDVGFDANTAAWAFNSGYKEGDTSARGIVYCESEIDTRAWSGITVRVILKGRSNGSGLGAFLEFFEEGDGLPALLISQWQEHLAMRSRRNTSKVERGYSEIGYRGLFSSGDFVELIVSSEGQRTHVYVDGQVVERRNDFSLLGEDNRFVGRLAIGNSADGTHPFTGEIRTVEIFDAFHRTNSSDFASATPVYAFDLSSRATPAGLYIPESFEPAKRKRLNPVNAANMDKPGYRNDVVVNSLGFIPVGICFAAAARRRVKSVIAVLVWVGIASFCLSFTIEWMQSYQVHRDSSQLDVLLNTLSGCVAVLVPKRWILFL